MEAQGSEERDFWTLYHSIRLRRYVLDRGRFDHLLVDYKTLRVVFTAWQEATAYSRLSDLELYHSDLKQAFLQG